MADLPELAPPWSRIPLVNDDTNLFPEPTVGAMATEITQRVVESPELSATIVDAIGSSTASIFEAKVATGSGLRNDINEWWVEPLAWSAGGVTFKGTIGGPDESLPPYVGSQDTFVAAPIILSEWHAGYPARSVVAGYINADDHNVPAVKAFPGRRRVAIWSGHYADNKTTFVLSDRDGSLDSMAVEAGNSQTFTRTGLTSYALCLLDESRSTSALSYYWLFQRVRRGTAPNYRHGWTVTEFTVDETRDSGGLTLISDSVSPGHGQRYFIRNEDGLSYMTGSARGGNVVRLLWGPHPSGGGGFSTIDIDMTTGSITGSGLAEKNIFFTPTDPNEGAIHDDDLVWDHPALPAGERRRLFYRERDGHLRAQWSIGDEDNATYLYAERVSGTVDGATTSKTGSILAPYRSEFDLSSGFKWEGFFKLPSTLGAILDLSRRYEESANGSWFIRVGTDGKVGIRIRRSTDTEWNYTFPTATPGILGSADWIGLRLEFVGNESGDAKARLSYSTDQGATWSTPQVGTNTGAITLDASTAPLRLGWGSSATNRDVILWKSVKLSTTEDVVVAQADFASTWPAGSTSNTDTQGNVWATEGTASVTRAADSYIDRNMGIAGPRIGHGAAANYIGGGCIVTNPDGSTRAVVTSHRDASVGESYLLVWRKGGGGAWHSTELYRTTDVLARPYQPRGDRGPVGLFVSVIRDYGQGENEFTDYASDVIAFAPV